MLALYIAIFLFLSGVFLIYLWFTLPAPGFWNTANVLIFGVVDLYAGSYYIKKYLEILWEEDVGKRNQMVREIPVLCG